jgi:hypothetical protein
VKVLVTGVSTRHCNGRSRTEYANAVPAMIAALTEGGAEVDHRQVEHGEDLSDYDAILLGWTQPNSIATQPKRLIGASWACQEYLSKIVVYYDDWSAMKCTSGGPKTILRTWDKRRKWYEDRIKRPITEEEAHSLLNMMRLFADEHPFKASLIPAFAWAQDSLTLRAAFNRTANDVLWDPTPFTDILDPIAPAAAPKEKRWVLATLQNHEEWLKKRALRWPVAQYGRPNERGFAGLGTGQTTGQELVPEARIKEVYAASWGVLAPKYPSPGWWRARFYHSAVAGCVLLPDESDALIMGPEFGLKGWQIEGKSDDALAELAARQRTWILARVTPREETVALIRRTLES